MSENNMKDAGWLVSGLKNVKINRGLLEKKQIQLWLKHQKQTKTAHERMRKNVLV